MTAGSRCIRLSDPLSTCFYFEKTLIKTAFFIGGVAICPLEMLRYTAKLSLSSLTELR